MFVVRDWEKWHNKWFMIWPLWQIYDHFNLFWDDILEEKQWCEIHIMPIWIKSMLLYDSYGRLHLDEKKISAWRLFKVEDIAVADGNTWEIRMCSECKKCWWEWLIRTQWGDESCDCIFSSNNKDVVNKTETT
jgi:hypothetical protein